MHKKLNDLGLISITRSNYEVLSFLESEGMKIIDCLIYIGTYSLSSIFLKIIKFQKIF